MGGVNETGSRPQTHGAHRRPDLAQAPDAGPTGRPAAPKAGSASGKNVTWSKASTADPCRTISPKSLKPILKEIDRAVKEFNKAEDPLQKQKVEEKIRGILGHDVKNLSADSGHLALVSDPDARRVVDRCVSTTFADEGIGGRFVGETTRDLQYARVIVSLTLLDADTKRTDKHDTPTKKKSTP